MRKRRKYTKAFIQRHLDDQACSGLSAHSYCRGAGIEPTTFYRWRKRNRKGPGDFIRASVKEEAISESPESDLEEGAFCLTLPGGIQAHLQEIPSPQWVASLIAHLERP